MLKCQLKKIHRYRPVHTPICWALPQNSKFGSLIFYPQSRGFQKGPPVRQKLRKEVDFLETGCFGPKAIPWMLADLRPPPNNYLYVVGLVLKISSSSFHSIKLFNFLFQTDRQTDRQTHRCMHIHRGKFFIPFLDTFLFPMFMNDKT